MASASVAIRLIFYLVTGTPPKLSEGTGSSDFQCYSSGMREAYEGSMQNLVCPADVRVMGGATCPVFSGQDSGGSSECSAPDTMQFQSACCLLVRRPQFSRFFVAHSHPPTLATSSRQLDRTMYSQQLSNGCLLHTQPLTITNTVALVQRIIAFSLVRPVTASVTSPRRHRASSHPTSSCLPATLIVSLRSSHSILPPRDAEEEQQRL